MEVRGKDHGVFTVVTNNIERVMKQTTNNEITKMTEKDEGVDYYAVDINEGDFEALNDFIVYGKKISSIIKKDKKTKAENLRKINNFKKDEKIDSGNVCKITNKIIVNEDKSTKTAIKSNVNVNNEIAQNTFNNQHSNTSSTTINSIKLNGTTSLINCTLDKNKNTTRNITINANNIIINTPIKNNTKNTNKSNFITTRNTKNTTNNSTPSTNNNTPSTNINPPTTNNTTPNTSNNTPTPNNNNDGSRKSINSTRTISSIILKTPKPLINGTERKIYSIKSILKNKPAKTIISNKRPQKLQKIKSQLYTGQNTVANKRILDEVPKCEFINPVKWHLFPTPEARQNMTKVQLGPYYMVSFEGLNYNRIFMFHYDH